MHNRTQAMFRLVRSNTEVMTHMIDIELSHTLHNKGQNNLTKIRKEQIGHDKLTIKDTKQASNASCDGAQVDSGTQIRFG